MSVSVCVLCVLCVYVCMCVHVCVHVRERKSLTLSNGNGDCSNWYRYTGTDMVQFSVLHYVCTTCSRQIWTHKCTASVYL